MAETRRGARKSTVLLVDMVIAMGAVLIVPVLLVAIAFAMAVVH